MKVVTETYLRTWIRKSRRSPSFCLPPGAIITPAARQYLNEQRIDLLQDVEQSAPEEREGKPEHMTQLHGTVLVQKDHSRIFFRGRLDSLQSEILILHGRAKEYSEKLADHLEELLDWVRRVLQAEVLEKPLEERNVFAMSVEDLREHSHQPRKFYGIGHILPVVDMDPILLELNRLRSTIREIELVAVQTFVASDHPAAGGILQAMNRMSSAIYVLMLRYKDNKYVSGR